ncbi:hypothetical protein [Schleiferilactobacillus perolens]|uniref:hypothetical protein n=1 Tax=Schleiferilactobacillus perolens TaxID=100468 RepID=UPI002357311E|nr:hypothetical protein [Schleiferilactobacillus perolens]MCI2170305.1 hypothetical protein [Schleiferilactobacillus perolens]
MFKRGGGQRTIKWIIYMMLTWAMVGSFFMGSLVSVQAETVGDVFDNTPSISGDVPNSGAGPWNTYWIPGIERERSAKEGSFVKWGYDGWADGDPENRWQKPPIYEPMPITVDHGVDTGGVGNSKDWKNQVSASPTSILFNRDPNGNVINQTEHGEPFFSLNYVNSPELIDYKTPDLGSAFAQSGNGGSSLTQYQKENIFNSQGVTARTKGDGKGGYTLADGANYNGGFIQATGNVPIYARVAESETTADAIMGGNWGVMVKVQVAPGIDAKSLAATIDWSKSYYFLSVDAIKIPLLGTSITNINFPLQFDHHVYLDPSNPQVFFLKVKGIPFNVLNSNEGGKMNRAMLELQKGNADYLDYLHNRKIKVGSSPSADTLDKFIDGKTRSNVLNDDPSPNRNQLFKRGQNGEIQPNFQWSQKRHDGIWDPLSGMLIEVADDAKIITGLGSLVDGALTGITSGIVQALADMAGNSPIYDTGDIGRMITLVNAGTPSPDRKLSDLDFNKSSGIFAVVWNLIKWMFTSFGQFIRTTFIDPILKSITLFLMHEGFRGNAHVNFSFNISQYSGSTDKLKAALTEGKLPAAPYSDGKFNLQDGMGEMGKNDLRRAPIQISMFGTNQLVDPYHVTKNLQRESSKSLVKTDLPIPLRQQMKAGTSPMDYAVIKRSEKNNGTRYPVYTNFSSWTGAIVPYDRHYYDDKNGSKNDTLHSGGRLSAGYQERTATPDPGLDGILVNDPNQDGTIGYMDPYDETNFFDPKPEKKLAGVISPSRYANVYSLYDYKSAGNSTPQPWPDDKGPQRVKDGDQSALAIKVNNPDGVNAQDDGAGNKTITSLNNKKWHFEGTMNGVPLADATVHLRQSLKPAVDLSANDYLALHYDEVKDKNQITEPLGYFRDPLGNFAPGGHQLQGTLNSANSKQSAFSDTFQSGNTRHRIMSNWSEKGNDSAVEGDPKFFTVDGKTGNATVKYQMPPVSAPKDNLYFGNLRFLRQGGVKTVGGYTLNAESENDPPANHLVFLNRETPDEQWYSLTKQFADGSDTYFVSADTQSITVNGTAKGKEIAAGKYPTQIYLMVPKVTGTFSQMPQVSGAQKVEPIPGRDTNDLYSTYRITFSTGPKQFTYSYQYSMNSYKSVPLNVNYRDVLRTDTHVMATSNPVHFAEQMNVNLEHVPSLAFGKQFMPSPSGAAYDLPHKRDKDSDPNDDKVGTAEDDQRREAYLTVRDHQQGQNSWNVTAALSPFTTNDGKERRDFRINWQEPAKIKDERFNTERVPDGSYHDPTDTAHFPAYNPAPLRYWRYYNHLPAAEMGTDSTPIRLYKLDRLVEPLNPNETPADPFDLTIHYPHAQLIVPKNAAGIATPETDSEYAATITYTLSSGNDGI